MAKLTGQIDERMGWANRLGESANGSERSNAHITTGHNLICSAIRNFDSGIHDFSDIINVRLLIEAKNYPCYTLLDFSKGD
jgi:hypothetical protein